MVIGIIGGGVFGRAVASLLAYNGVTAKIVDIGETLDQAYDVVVLAVPVQGMRQALKDNAIAFTDETCIIGCSKGLEKGTSALPSEIFAATIGKGDYFAMSGPSFAKELMERVPTVVDVASVTKKSVSEVRKILETPYFKIEEHESLIEIELAGALKNVYAVAAGFIAGAGGGANTHAHLQVVALREFQTIAEAHTGRREVVHPSVVGDLGLTSGSPLSRNYRYGFARATGEDLPGVTVEGKETVAPLLALAKREGISVPLAEAVAGIIEHGAEARDTVYRALGF